jgi:hypothetical protein
MKKLICIILLAIGHIQVFCQDNIGKVVPDSWISRALKNENQLDLIQEFNKLFPAQNIEFPSSQQPYLNITKINLDDDEDSEYVLFLGTDYSRTTFYIIDNDYKIIFQEYLWLHNEYPELLIFNSNDQHKTLSYKYLYSRGSGQWLFTRKFIRVYDGKALLVLEIVNDSNNTFNEVGINGRIKLERIE